MRKKIIYIVMLLAAFSCITGAAAAASVYFEPESVTLSPGSATQVKVYLSDAPQGLTGYEMILTYPSSKVTATGASFPSWAGLNNKYSTASGYLISGIDLNKQVQSGATAIELGTVTLKGVAAGTTTITLTGFRMNDDKDSLFTPTLGTLQVTVEGSGTTVTTTTTTAAATATTAATTVTTAATATTTKATTTTAPVTTGTTTAATTAAATTTTVIPAVTVTVPSVVIVTPALAGSPACGFTVNKVAGYAPMEVRFRDLSTGESISGWEWNFGDGGSSMAQSPTYTYRTPGTYTVSLKVTNDLGSTTSTRTGLIRVLNEGEAMPTVTQAAPVQTTVESTARQTHTIPAWTSPQKTATPTKAAPDILTIIAATGLVLAGYAVMRDNRDR
jgi:PKD repeat protein